MENVDKKVVMKNKLHPNLQDLYTLAELATANPFLSRRPTYDTGYFPLIICAPTQCYKTTPISHLYHEEHYYTLKYFYALQVWNQMIYDIDKWLLYRLMPHWEDRDDSFRRLVNHKDFKEEDVNELWQLLERIANSGDIQVCEGTWMDYSAPSDCRLKYEKDYVGRFSNIFVVDAETGKAVEEKVKERAVKDYDRSPRTFCWQDIASFFREVSLAERELLHASVLHRRMTDLDRALMKACDMLDVKLVEDLVRKGANVNALHEGGMSALGGTLAGLHGRFEYDQDKQPMGEDELHARVKVIVNCLVANGADLDLFGHGGTTPLVECYYTRSPEMMEFLLKLGANPNVNCFIEDDNPRNEYCSAALWLIDEELYEEYDDVSREMERILIKYGAVLKNDKSLWLEIEKHSV